MPFLKFFILELESCREGFSSDAADSKMKNDPKFFSISISWRYGFEKRSDQLVCWTREKIETVPGWA